MGLCLHTRDRKYEMDMGAGSFYNLRCVIADLLDPTFGTNYRNLTHCYTKQDYEQHDAIANSILARKNLNENIVEFLYMPDMDGSISASTCKAISELVADYDDDNMYGYVYANHTFKYFKEMLAYCVEHRRKLYWH